MKKFLKPKQSLVILLTATGLLFSSKQSNAGPACLVGTLTINTGEYNSLPLGVGASDPLWTISNKTAPFLGGGAPPIGANALVVKPVSTWGASAWGGGQWICDYGPHANPGISTTTGSEITFRRIFRMCSEDVVTFHLDVLCDNRIQDILVDGISTGIHEAPFPPVISHYGPGKDSFITFSRGLGNGIHSIDIVVDDEYGAAQNPVGLLVSGYITSPGVALINDFSSSCANYQCGSPILPEGNHTGTFGLGENQILAVNTLFQSVPNPSNGETTIGYNIADMKVSAYIAVYNIAGEQVKKFDVNTTGRGKIIFDATNIKAGYYSYRLVVDGVAVDTKKLIVTK